MLRLWKDFRKLLHLFYALVRLLVKFGMVLMVHLLSWVLYELHLFYCNYYSQESWSYYQMTCLNKAMGWDQVFLCFWWLTYLKIYFGAYSALLHWLLNMVLSLKDLSSVCSISWSQNQVNGVHYILLSPVRQVLTYFPSVGLC